MSQLQTSSPRGSSQVLHIVLNLEEIHALSSWLPPIYPLPPYRDSLIVSSAVLLGLRRAEISTLRVGNFQVHSGVPWLIDFIGKGQYTRSVPIPNLLYRRYLDYFIREGLVNPSEHAVRQTRGQRNRICPNCVYDVIKKRTRAILGYSVRPHMLRHSIATAWLQQGVDIKTVQTLLGHQNIATTSRYLHSSPEKMINAIGIISPLEGIQTKFNMELTSHETPDRRIINLHR
ncbi:MAG: site-specific integrase [Desulfobulbaceae bacterium]|nr:site-specific integrase [Desulfobulbaceae bacterium]